MVVQVAKNQPLVYVDCDAPKITSTQTANNVEILAGGLQGEPGPPGASDVTETRTASEALGGHRIVRSTGAGLAGYASNADDTHGDDTLGMTIGAAAQGALVQVQTNGSIMMSGWTWTPGLPVFLGINGLPTQTPPEAGFIQVVGHAESATSIFLKIEPPIYY